MERAHDDGHDAAALVNGLGGQTEVQEERRRIRVLHLVSHPIQYFAPLYREVAQRPEVDLTVLYYSTKSAAEYFDQEFGRRIQWDVPLLDGYSYSFPPSASTTPITGSFLRRRNWDVVRRVFRGDFDVLWCHGYAHLTTWLSVAAARIRGRAVLLREEQTLLTSRPWWKRALKSVALRLLFSQISGLYIGEQNRLYFRHYGVDDSRLYAARYCVDGRTMTIAVDALPDRGTLRAEFGVVDDAPIVLFSGKLVERKGPRQLVEAFRDVRQSLRCWLLLVGDGPLFAAIEAETKGCDEILLAGFLNQRDLPRAYAAADIFVLPSQYDEPWGLVVNEALQCGLPVVVTSQVGCSADLVRDGWNGYVVPPSDVRALSKAIRSLVEDEERRRIFGTRGRDLIRDYTIEACADGIVAACCARATRGARGEKRP